jgi:hypothetical protein
VPGLCHASSDERPRTAQTAATPRNVAKNHGLITATFMDCMAAMPWAGGREARAFITNVENAKKTPAISPQPSADMRVEAKSNLLIIGKLRSLEHVGSS